MSELDNHEEPEVGDPLSADATDVYDELQAEDHAAAAAGAGATEGGWWEYAYRGSAPPVGPESLTRALYYPNNPAEKPASPAGADVEAFKRAISRAGRWPWQTFDRAYSRGFALGTSGMVGHTGVAGFQRQQGIQATGQLGDTTYQALRYALVPEGFPHEGEHVLDGYAVELLEQYAASVPDDDELDQVRDAIADYCLESIQWAGGIHYRQERPIACFGVPPADGFTTDCSGHSTAAYYWARDVTGLPVPDPNHRGFDGYGYTGTLIGNPHVTSGAYKRGDLALYGPSTSATSHVCTCLRDGNSQESEWCSHGSEEAPYLVQLHYRSDLLVVVRPALLP